MDRAEGRGQRALVRTLDDRRSPDQRSEVLVSDLARQQQQHQDAQAEGRHEATLLPLTRRNHPYAYPDPKSRLHGSVGKRRRYGANATDIFIVGLTLWA